MRILFLTQFFPPEVGATQARMHHFARRLAEKGHGVTVITELPNHPKGVVFPGYRRRLFRRTKEDNVDVIRLWVYASPRKSALRRLLFYFSYMFNAVLAGLFLARGRYDIIFATSPPLPVVLAAYWVALFKRRPFVMDVRDLWPAVGVAIGEIRGKAMVRMGERLEGFLYRKAAAITCVTRGFMDYMAVNGIAREKVYFLPNGTVPEVFHPERVDHSLRRRLGLEHKFVVGFCGNHGVAQGLPSVLEAAGLLREQEDIAFLFVGEGPAKQSLLDTKSREQLDNVLLLPQVPVDEIACYINACDVMLAPLRKDEIFTYISAFQTSQRSRTPLKRRNHSQHILLNPDQHSESTVVATVLGSKVTVVWNVLTVWVQFAKHAIDGTVCKFLSIRRIKMRLFDVSKDF